MILICITNVYSFDFAFGPSVYIDRAIIKDIDQVLEDIDDGSAYKYNAFDKLGTPYSDSETFWYGLESKIGF